MTTESHTELNPTSQRMSSDHKFRLPSLRLGIEKSTDQDDEADPQDHPELQWHRWSDALHHFWRQSLLRATFSPSLPQTEESEFEEKFKYMIVTSPFISSNTASTNLGKNKRNASFPHMTTDYPTPATRVSRAGKVGTAAVMTGLLTSLGAEAIMMIQQQYDESVHNGGQHSPFRFLMSATTLATASMASFFFYRHKRRSDIRQLYRTALINLQALMEQCGSLDNKVSRCILMIEEFESLRRGRTCTLLRSCVQAVLRRIFIRFEEAIIDLTEHVNKSTLSHLFDMYNIRSFSSLSSMDQFDEPDQQDSLRTLWQLVHAKRRECMVQFLALNIVSEAHDSGRMGYTDSWDSINQVLASLADEIGSFVSDIMDALETELYAPALENTTHDTQATLAVDRPLEPFVESVEMLNRQIRALDTKIHVCEDNLRELASVAAAAADAPATAKGEQDRLRGRLKYEYQSIEVILNDVLLKWQQGQEALLGALDTPELSRSPSRSPTRPRRYRMSFPHALDLTASALPDITRKSEDILPPSPASMGESNNIESKKYKIRGIDND